MDIVSKILAVSCLLGNENLFSKYVQKIIIKENQFYCLYNFLKLNYKIQKHPI